ncbi:MAG: hypothetical protein LUQ66_09990 [Methanoregula sp.]|nr:hypothetical protein [Methanoregula sp.]
MRQGRRRRDLGDTPWITIAAIVGVIAVVILALVFFLGGGSDQSSTTSPSVSSSAALQTTKLSNQGVASITVKTTTAPTVPVSGVWIMVDYIGSYKGSYGMPSNLQKVEQSGIRLFEVVNATGTVQATFAKKDSSAKHDLSVTIYKDGKAVKVGDNSSAYGIVSIRYP